VIRVLIEELPSFAIVLVLALGMQALDYYGWLAGPEGKVMDRLLSMQRSPHAESPIVLVEIDDEAYRKCFQETSPMNPQAVAATVAAVASQPNPWVVGVDILTDSDLHKNEYRVLEPVLRQLRPRIVWISGAEESKYEVASFWPWLLGVRDELIVKPTPVLGYPPGELADHPKIAWGLPVYPRDEDSGVRRFPREIQLSADPEHSSMSEPRRGWARLIAEEYCHSGAKCNDQSGDEVLVSYSAPEPRRFSMLDLFACPANGQILPIGPQWTKFVTGAQHNIVLIGGTFRNSGDFHETPIGRQSGLLINAYSVQAEIDGSGIHEARRPVALLFDFVVGVLIVLVLPGLDAAIGRLAPGDRWRRELENNKIRWTMSASAFIVVLAIAGSLMLCGRGYLLSFLGVALGVMAHQIVEIWKLNPTLRPHRHE
jgi:hypothetical protein